MVTLGGMWICVCRKYHLEFTCFALSCDGVGFGGAVVTSDECVQLHITASGQTAKQWSFQKNQPHLCVPVWLSCHPPIIIIIIIVMNHPLSSFC